MERGAVKKTDHGKSKGNGLSKYFFPFLRPAPPLSAGKKIARHGPSGIKGAN